MYNRRYDKSFVMLKQELGGFSLGQQSAWGSCVMELKNGKGRFTFSVQGLKKLTDGRRYDAFVIGGKGDEIKGICCGTVEVDAHGKGELKWEFDPDAIGKSAFHAEELHTVALIVKGGYGLIVPLAGYFHDKVQWKKLFQEENDLVAAEAVLLKTPEKKLTSIKEKNTNNIIKQEPEQPQYPDNIVKEENKRNVVTLKSQDSPFQKNFKNMLFQFKQELEKLEQNGIITKQQQQNILQSKTNNNTEQQSENDVVQKQNNTEIKISQQKTEQNTIIEQNKEIAYILQYNDNIQPFEQGNWKSIALEELIVLPMNATEMMKHLFYIFAYRKYKHFILQKTGEKEYMIGVPAQYSSEKRREAEQLSFELFQPCGKEVMKEGCYGYWLRKIRE